MSSVPASSAAADFYDRWSDCLKAQKLPVPPRDLFSSREKAAETFRKALEAIVEDGQKSFGFESAKEGELGEMFVTVFGGEAEALVAFAGLEAADNFPKAQWMVVALICAVKNGVPKEWLPKFELPTVEAPAKPANPPQPLIWQIVTPIVLVLLGLLIAALFIYGKPVTTSPTTPTPPPAASSSYYLHWNCGGDSQCEGTLGADIGVRGPESQADCQNAINTSVSGGWCDTSNQPESQR